jgi:hypothetical protein
MKSYLRSLGRDSHYRIYAVSTKQRLTMILHEEAKDITWEEMKKEWKKLNKDAGWI